MKDVIGKSGSQRGERKRREQSPENCAPNKADGQIYISAIARSPHQIWVRQIQSRLVCTARDGAKVGRSNQTHSLAVHAIANGTGGMNLEQANKNPDQWSSGRGIIWSRPIGIQISRAGEDVGPIRVEIGLNNQSNGPIGNDNNLEQIQLLMSRRYRLLGLVGFDSLKYIRP